jgi:hypothetical protein
MDRLDPPDVGILKLAEAKKQTGIRSVSACAGDASPTHQAHLEDHTTPQEILGQQVATFLEGEIDDRMLCSGLLAASLRDRWGMAPISLSLSQQYYVRVLVSLTYGSETPRPWTVARTRHSTVPLPQTLEQGKGGLRNSLRVPIMGKDGCLNQELLAVTCTYSFGNGINGRRTNEASTPTSKRVKHRSARARV